MSSLDYLDLCRLCLVKDRVSVPIFEGEGDVRQIFLKITACLPVKVAREDKLPKKICDDCVYKVELIYQFWHTTANAEKQLLQWLGEVNMEDKQGYVGTVLNPNGMKPEQSNENRLDGTVMQQVSEHQNNMTMGMMDNMGLTMPMMMSSSTQQQITSVPIDNSGSSVQNVQPVAGPSTQTSHDQITQDQTNASTQQEEEEESSEEEENSDDECDGDEGLPIKEESEEDPNRTIEPTTFVNVSLACDEAGPSGLQQQKIADMPEMVMSQTSDVDPKTGYFVSKLTMLPKDRQQCRSDEVEHIFVQGHTQLLIADSLNVSKMETTDILVHESVMQCEFCGDSFTSDQALTLHLETHESYSEGREQSQDEQLVCENCGYSFSTMPELREHQKEQHEEYYSCDDGGYVTSPRESLIDHQRTQNWRFRNHPENVAIPRQDQGASFVIFQDIDDKTILVEEIAAYHCDSCNEDFDTEASLIVHRTEQSILRTREALRQAEKKYECDICGETFSRKLQLIKHRRMRCKYSLDTQKKQEWKDTITRIKKNRQESKELLAGPIECDECHKIFKKKRYLNVHKTLHGAPHICHVCGAKLTSEYYLKIHIRRHNKEFTEFCKVCNKGFYLKATLKTHMSVHTDEKPCICEICHKSFGNRVYLRSHMKIHSLPEMRKKYKCEICNFETFYSYCYKEHMWTHTGESQVACEVCGKLIRRQYMKTHIRIHTGEKPEICEFCGKAFSARKYLIKHRRTHTGEKPYKCKICEKRFTQRGTLSAHLRRHENLK
ncbi:zinc finger protein 30-like isoform X3 [Polyergus mexicanus]|uniref:zinc finger protein 30-like isoform X3 n=1 Tax=Polyergus mexicanus TaxID=615972 RepID=UPI0038B47FB8